MRKLTVSAFMLAAWIPCSLMAQSFMFLAPDESAENIDKQLVTEINSQIDAFSPGLDEHFRNLAAQCSGDILVFADGKALCGELVDMPPLTQDGSKSSVDISEVSAIIFDSEKDPPTVHYILGDGRTIINQLSKEAFRFSVEYLENGGEQRIQIFYISPADIRYIIISPRLPNSPPGINTANQDRANELSNGSAKVMPDSRVVEAVQLAALWYHPDSHSLLADAVAAIVLPSHAITTMHDATFSDIVAYYAELGAVDEETVDFHHVAFDDYTPDSASSQNSHGLILGPKALFSALESFDSFHELAFADAQSALSEINMLATAGATSFNNAFILDDRQAHNLFAMEFDLHYNSDENSEDDDDFDLSGIQYMADNEDPLLHDPLIEANDEAAYHIAFSTDSCSWFEHKYQCADGCNAEEWPPAKKEESVHSAAEHVHDFDQLVLSDVMDKIKQNEIIAIEAMFLDPPSAGAGRKPDAVSQVMPNKQPVVRIGGNLDIASYPVSNQDYYRFVQATKHQPPSHWVEGIYVQAEAYAPVVNITYRDAVAYAEWAGERLPSYDELAAASGSLDPMVKEFKEWTSTPSVVDSEYVRVYRKKGPELLLQPETFSAPNVGFRCIKAVE